MGHIKYRQRYNVRTGDRRRGNCVCRSAEYQQRRDRAWGSPSLPIGSKTPTHRFLLPVAPTLPLAIVIVKSRTILDDICQFL